MTNFLSGTVSVINGVTAPLFQVTGGSLTVTGNLASIPSTATLTLSHPALDVLATGSVTANADLINVGGTLTVDSRAPLVKISKGGALTIQGAGSDLLAIGSTGVVSLGGPVLLANADPAIEGSVVRVAGGGVLKMTASAEPAPAVLLFGGTHSLASGTGAAVFDLTGDPEQFLQGISGSGEDYFVSVASNRPIEGPPNDGPDPLPAPLVGVNNATLGTGTAVKLDLALLEASAPLLNWFNSTGTVTDTVFVLANKAFLDHTGSTAFLFDASTVNVNAGSFLALTGGSLVRVAGNFLSLQNGSILNLNDTANGFLVSLAGGSVLDVFGGLIEFVGTGNQINVANTFVPDHTVTVGSHEFRFRLTDGASAASQIKILGTPVQGSGTGTIAYPGAGTGALFEINGAAAEFIVRGNP